MTAPPSKSHAHRLLIARFLAGDRDTLADDETDAADIRATKRCLRALAEPTSTPSLDCGESGSTLRFLAPVAAALGKQPVFLRRGRLAERPFKPYPTLESGVHELPGNVSSQFVTGLLFALPLLSGDSAIRFTSTLESRGYVDMTLDVLRQSGVCIRETENGFDIPGGQRFSCPGSSVEGDWSGGAFWLAMNELGSDVRVSGLESDSAQPDRAIVDALHVLRAVRSSPCEIDVSQCPDIFPVLTVVAAASDGIVNFSGIRRLRLKECDRVAAMADVLARFGRTVDVSDACFRVHGRSGLFRGGSFLSFSDHRIAMSVAVGATRADASVALDDVACANKSYPGFFDLFHGMARGVGF